MNLSDSYAIGFKLAHGSAERQQVARARRDLTVLRTNAAYAIISLLNGNNTAGQTAKRTTGVRTTSPSATFIPSLQRMEPSAEKRADDAEHLGGRRGATSVWWVSESRLGKNDLTGAGLARGFAAVQKAAAADDGRRATPQPSDAGPTAPLSTKQRNFPPRLKKNDLVQTKVSSGGRLTPLTRSMQQSGANAIAPSPVGSCKVSLLPDHNIAGNRNFAGFADGSQPDRLQVLAARASDVHYDQDRTSDNRAQSACGTRPIRQQSIVSAPALAPSMADHTSRLHRSAMKSGEAFAPPAPALLMATPKMQEGGRYPQSDPGADPGYSGAVVNGTLTPAEALNDSRQERNGAGQMQGDVYLDGTLLGRWISRSLSREAARPPAGGAAFDPRRSPLPPGRMIGA